MSLLDHLIPRRSFFRSILGAATIPFVGKPKGVGQPRPSRAWYAYHSTGGRWVTAIFREWRNGDEARCRLCDEGQCRAKDGFCAVSVDVLVPIEEMKMFSTVGFGRTRGPESGDFPARPG